MNTARWNRAIPKGTGYCLHWLLPLLLFGGASTAFAEESLKAETVCDDGVDNDNDSVADCADADCASFKGCQPGGGPENSDALCSDWVDNDGDGAIDCDDEDCEGPGLTICKGSWVDPNEGDEPPPDARMILPADSSEGLAIEDLLGRGNDIDGERNDVLCSDGLDNDEDGMTDCADPGCRFDPNVTICQGNLGFRFSVVAGISQALDLVQYQANQDIGDNPDENRTSPMTTKFERIQLRTFGPIPKIQDSFFLMSMRVEKTPRLTFLMFQIPIGGGHYLNLNSGSGGMSSALIISASKQILLDPPYYVYNAFEQGNGAAIELGGPIGTGRRLNYRAFASGGTGRFAGNVGGGYFTDSDFNYSYSAGAQLALNVVGYVSRWDNNFLFTPATPAFGLRVGGKYEQRSLERYPALNFNGSFRWNRLVLLGESYVKRELAFQSTQYSWVLQGGFLLVPKKLFVAADFGQFVASEMEKELTTQEDLDNADELKLGNEQQWRVALHYYFYRNIGILSVLYRDSLERAVDPDEDDNREKEIRFEAQYRF